ncbi:hypothetical protein PFICI_11852 [Pestalotiopsis fici W106-1]|uniref:Zn(2)-C6 fungal-type domain-containing protein n=1 Tax=Pestalotiopsis fici (strain W106-1 / CGMCC3.15140) TaxID=1229662 RepID=W3WRG9_PESFW|nr:uncharacterized protein PFICI_11852 [Pestalotiopsis fici W106-1]ETS76465.1 hypothetical protein PFICI_11852 [Pestalotiopsis fici W106-1]
MDPNSVPASRGSRATRSSLACLPCRSRHLKCDGKRPECARCTESARQCHYTESRRGGVSRASLAERRSRQSALNNNSSHSSSCDDMPEIRQEQLANGYPDQDYSFRLPDLDVVSDPAGLTSATTSNAETPAGPLDQNYSLDNDALVQKFYRDFHRFHPMVVPWEHLVRLYQDPDKQPRLAPLVAVLRLIGHLFDAQAWSQPLQNFVEACFSQAHPAEPVMVQCRLLYSMALFWFDKKDESMAEMDSAVQLATTLGMHRRDFATAHGSGDPVLAESWRRTWWWIYIIDAYYVGTLRNREFAVKHIDADVELPCNEIEYEQGDIPTPQTLENFNCREFYPEAEFSSFAYLIGAVKSAASAITMSPKRSSKEASSHVIQAADAMIDGWHLLLPKKLKNVMSRSGDIDELMFQAHLVLHVATIGLHRPLSELRFNSVEDHSSCAREPRPEMTATEQISIHTIRVLRSVEAQVRILALPVRPFNHTPFTTCMVSEGTLALLSACNFLLEGKEREIARDQIRLIIGCLTSLGELWPRTARNVKEIQFIARHVFGLESKGGGNATPTSIQEPILCGGGESQKLSGPDLEILESNGILADGITNNADDWYTTSDLSRELSWWINE